MINFSPGFPSLLNSSNEFYTLDPDNKSYPGYGYTFYPAFNNAMAFGNISHYDTGYIYSSFEICVIVLTIVFCFFGLMGNGTIIWLLTFCIQRNPFTTFILNLAVVDFGVLLFIPLIIILYLCNLYKIFYPYFYLEDLFMYMYIPGQFLLTAISMDRCVSVHFPLWHRCHRPKHLSTIVCAVIWVISFLLCLIPSTLNLIDATRYYTAMACLSVSIALLCLPLMTISTLFLFMKVCLKPTQHQRGNILTAILLTLLFYIILAFPFNIFFSIIYFSGYFPFSLSIYGFLCASLNSSVNPLIYFLVGRQKKGQYRETLKVILHKVFNEEQEPPVQIPL
ncbi:mas-related G-protein coupled receptor member A1-like [Sceloporus undulatus]|uniref:mas-related G-protein coupled receptor member A1-like n=1 Tax=Sceloporus undulatus TaxID=8520 RepID=UPI001C4D157B|nr:mas-related G-protein coupled receptor member A1-like [Sceloporus undulatus]